MKYLIMIAMLYVIAGCAKVSQETLDARHEQDVKDHMEYVKSIYDK